jgi:hypothetical protein
LAVRANAGPTQGSCQLVFVLSDGEPRKRNKNRLLRAKWPGKCILVLYAENGAKSRLHREGRRFESVTAHHGFPTSDVSVP